MKNLLTWISHSSRKGHDPFVLHVPGFERVQWRGRLVCWYIIYMCILLYIYTHIMGCVMTCSFIWIVWLHVIMLTHVLTGSVPSTFHLMCTFLEYLKNDARFCTSRTIWVSIYFVGQSRLTSICCFVFKFWFIASYQHHHHHHYHIIITSTIFVSSMSSGRQVQMDYIVRQSSLQVFPFACSWSFSDFLPSLSWLYRKL